MGTLSDSDLMKPTFFTDFFLGNFRSTICNGPSRGTTRAVCHRDSPLSANDANDLLVGDEEPISRLPYRPMGGSVFKYLTMNGHKTGVPTGTYGLTKGRPLSELFLYPD